MAQQRNERVGRTEKVALTFTHGHVLKRQLVGSCYKAEGAQRLALRPPRGAGSGEGREAIHV